MYVNIFRNRKRADMDAGAYAADAERMMELARAQKGFIAFRSYTSDDGEVLAMSEWEAEEDARAWLHNVEHTAVQERGRSDYYESYTSYSCNDPRIRQFERSKA